MTEIVLPDALASWPWPRQINVHYADVKVEAEEWIHSLNAFDGKAQKAFDKCDFALLASLAYPHLSRPHLRIACDLMMFFFVFDEYTDKVDGGGVRAYIDMVEDALEHPYEPRPQGECALGEVARQFWVRAIQTTTPAAQRRFIKTFIEYIEAVVQEATDRLNATIRSLDDYLALRRLTAGGYPSLFPIEISANIPDEVMQHPSLSALNDLVAESLILLNDIYSYNIEQASGHHAHNLVTVVMHERNIDIQSALEWIRSYHVQCLERFISIKDGLPLWGEAVDREVAAYVEGLAAGIRGIDSWCFESQRYFGRDGLQIQRHRVVKLLPKAGLDAATPMTVPDIISSPKTPHFFLAPDRVISSSILASLFSLLLWNMAVA